MSAVATPAPAGRRPRIAVFTGPMPTITNTAPLITSDKARRQYGLAPDPQQGDRPDVLRPQRLAAPVTVFIEAFSAHPLEQDASALYAPPDGYLDAAGRFSVTEPAGGGRPVHRVELRPEDGLYLLPYMARRADGRPWDAAALEDGAAPARTRQTFLPDASRLYEEIERFGLENDGRGVRLRSLADFDFFRAAPGSGWTGGRAADRRTDRGAGDIPPETLGADYFPYEPAHLARIPDLATLARITNQVQQAADSGLYRGLQWLESSATIEESLYWFNLVIDTRFPIVGHAAHRTHGAVSPDGPKNITDGVKYLTSRVWSGPDGADRIGAVLVTDELVFTAREVAKTDARPGGYVAAGGHGGVVADLGAHWAPQLTFVPNRLHTHTSALRLPLLPGTVRGVRGRLGAGRTIQVRTKDEGGLLRPETMPVVRLEGFGHFIDTGAPGIGPVPPDVELIDRIEQLLAASELPGLVVEGLAPYGSTDPARDAALRAAVFGGVAVVRTGRGHPGGMTYRGDRWSIAGNNLTATKARILLRAALLRLGALPVAADPFAPTLREEADTAAALAAYQNIFDTH